MLGYWTDCGSALMNEPKIGSLASAAATNALTTAGGVTCGVTKSLAGFTVVVTRPARQALRFTRLLRDHGAAL